MDLFLVPNNPERTVLVSPNGVAHYQITTSKRKGCGRVSSIRRPAETEQDSLVAEIEWKCWDSPTMIRSPLLGGLARSTRTGTGITASKFLYKLTQFSSSRYFLGDDGVEYRWKIIKGIGCVLTNSETKEEIARFGCALTDEGLYAGERKSRLHIQPCSVDIDLIIISFMIMEKKRRDHAGDGTKAIAHDEDPGDGGGSADAGGGTAGTGES